MGWLTLMGRHGIAGLALTQTSIGFAQFPDQASAFAPVRTVVLRMPAVNSVRRLLALNARGGTYAVHGVC